MKIVPEIMIPLVGTKKELQILRDLSVETINKFSPKRGPRWNT